MPWLRSEAKAHWLDTNTEWLGKRNFRLTTETREQVAFTRDYTPGWAILLAIFLFPIGLLFLLAKGQWTLNLHFEEGHEAGDPTRVSLAGSMQRDMADHLLRQAAEYDAKEPTETMADPS